MIKVPFKYLLSLCILLVGGSAQLSAHFHKRTDNLRFPAKYVNRVEIARLANAAQHSGCLVTTHALFSTATQDPQLIEPLFEDQEDDDLSSFRKHLKNNHYVTSILFARAAGYFFSANAKNAHSQQEPFCSLPQRYLAFQVFRI